MKIRRGWGRNFMAKFSSGGAKKDTELEANLTPATKISGRLVESLKKLVNTAPTRCSSQQARLETADSSNMREKFDKKKQEERDKEITDGHSVNQEEPEAELDITMIVQSMKRGKRSAQQRKRSSVPWVELLGFNFRNVERAKKMKRTSRGSKSWCVNNRGAIGKKIVGGGSDASNQSTANLDKAQDSAADTDVVEHLSVPKSDTSSKSKEQCGIDADEYAADTDAAEYLSVLKSDTSSKSKEQCGIDTDECAADTDTVEHISVPKSDTSLKSKEQCGIDADEYASKQSGVPVPADDTLLNNIWTDFKESKDAVADGLMTTTDVISLYEAKEDHIKFDPAIIPGLDLEDGAEKFNTSTAQSAFASLSLSAPDPCIEFAVKILKDETPLTAYVPDLDEIIKKMMCHQKSTVAGTSKSKSIQGRKD